MSRREEYNWNIATNYYFCRWCRAWPRRYGNELRCFRCGHVDGEEITKLTARPGLLSTSKSVVFNQHKRQRWEEYLKYSYISKIDSK